MSFVTKLWKNRSSQFPYRRILTDVSTSQTQTVDVERAEGTVTEIGDTFDANTMNDLEARIASAFTAADQKMGDLSDLTTSDKSNLVAAINEAAAGGGGGSSTLAGLTDTSISNPSNGQVLKYNSTSSKWENAAESGGSGENYVVITYTTTKNSYDSGVVSSDFTKTSIVDQDGNAVSDGDVAGLIFNSGYGARLDLVYHNTTYSLEMSHKVASIPSSYSLSFPLFDVEISNNPAIIRTEVDVAFTGNVFSLIYEEYDYAPLHSPSFTGSPTAPTASVGHSGTRIATTAFVNNEIDNDTKFHKNDTVDLTPAVFAGRIDSDKKTIHFTIPLNKPLGSDITGVTTGGNFSIYTPSGAIFTSSTLASKGTVTHYLREYGIGVRLVLSTTYSTGSTPVSVYCNANNSMTFTGS